MASSEREFLTYIFQRFYPSFVLAFLGLRHPVSDRDKLPVDIFHTRCDSAGDRFLDLPLYETGGKRSESLVQEVVFRVTDRELERVNFDMDVLHLEDRALVLVGGHEVDGSLSPNKTLIRVTYDTH